MPISDMPLCGSKVTPDFYPRVTIKIIIYYSPDKNPRGKMACCGNLKNFSGNFRETCVISWRPPIGDSGKFA